jgi:hypothetical protein
MTWLASSAYVQFNADSMPEINASVRLTGSSRLYCHTYPDSAPSLSIIDAHLRVAVSVPDPDRVTGQDVQLARTLAELVARYVAELEHLAASSGDTGLGQHDTTGQAALWRSGCRRAAGAGTSGRPFLLSRSMQGRGDQRMRKVITGEQVAQI